MLNVYCKLQMELNNVLLCCLHLFTIVYCLEPTSDRNPDSHQEFVTSWSQAALITQATATALLCYQNAACSFGIAEPADWEIQRHLWEAFGICTAELTFQKQGAWSCHQSHKSARACKCNLHCCCLPAINSLIFTWFHLAAAVSEGW